LLKKVVKGRSGKRREEKSQEPLVNVNTKKEAAGNKKT